MDPIVHPPGFSCPAELGRLRRVGQQRRDDSGTAATAMDKSGPEAPGVVPEISESDGARRVLAVVFVGAGWVGHVRCINLRFFAKHAQEGRDDA